MRTLLQKTVLVLLLTAMALFLSACGKLNGKYYLKDGYGVHYLEFSGDQITISTLGIPVHGTYRIKGDQITVHTNVLGFESDTPYSFKRSGNTITFEGQTYIKSGSSGEAGSTGTVIAATVSVIILAGGAYFLLRKKPSVGEPRFDYAALGDKAARASRDLYVSAVSMGSRVASSVSANVSAGMAAGRAGIGITSAAAKEYHAARQTRKEADLFTGSFEDKWEEVEEYEDEEWEEVSNGRPIGRRRPEPVTPNRDLDDGDDVTVTVAIPYNGRRTRAPQAGTASSDFVTPSFRTIPIDAAHCCICGKALDGKATPLSGLPSGVNAYIDGSCHKVLKIAASTDNISEFNAAARYLKSRIPYVDPELAQALKSFIGKGEARLCTDRFDL